MKAMRMITIGGMEFETKGVEEERRTDVSAKGI